MALSLYGIFGDPLTHSLSPAMQERAFSHSGIQARYLVLPMGKKFFLSALSKPDRFPLQGFNVTIPYKETVISCLDKVSEEALRIGAVNTVYRRGRRLLGTNTDVFGFLQSLQKDAGFKVKAKKAVVLGAGGAARAAVYGLAMAGASEVAVFNRDAGRAGKMAGHFAKFFPKTKILGRALTDTGLGDALKASDLVVNATSLGLKKGDGLPVPEKILPGTGQGVSRKLFYDMIYSPPETDFLRAARRKGHSVLNGAGMLVYQGAQAFEFWTGRKAPVREMREALLAALCERDKNRKDAA